MWDRAAIELTTPESAIGLTTECATWPGFNALVSGKVYLLYKLLKEFSVATCLKHKLLNARDTILFGCNTMYTFHSGVQQ